MMREARRCEETGAAAREKSMRKGRPRAAFFSAVIHYLASSLDFLADFFDFFLGAILSFGASPLLMVSPLCAAGAVVPPALSVDWAKAVDERKARAVAARITLRIGWISSVLTECFLQVFSGALQR